MFSNDKAVRIINAFHIPKENGMDYYNYYRLILKKKTFKYYYLEINSRDASETTYIIGRLICSFSHNIISCFGSFHSLRPSPLPKKKKRIPTKITASVDSFLFRLMRFSPGYTMGSI
jgi:hypothetical protein